MDINQKDAIEKKGLSPIIEDLNEYIMSSGKKHYKDDFDLNVHERHMQDLGIINMHNDHSMVKKLDNLLDLHANDNNVIL